MKYKLYIDKDTYLNSRFYNRNYGAEQVLEISANTIYGAREIQRALLQLNLGSLSSVKNSNLFPQSLSGINSAYLVLKNCDHADAYMEDSTVYLYPVTGTWVAGRGIGKTYADNGFANYLNRTRTDAWTTSGGDFIMSNTAYNSSCYFEYGNEDGVFDITNLVKAWDNGSLTNNGIVLRLDTPSESGTANYGFKKFYSESTHTDYYPYIVFDYDWEEYDDRNELYLDTTQRLYTAPVRNFSTASSALTASVSASIYGISPTSITANIYYPITKWTLTSITATVHNTPVTSTTGVWISSSGFSYTSYTANITSLIGNYTASYDNQFKKYYIDIYIPSTNQSYSKYVDVWHFGTSTSATSSNEFKVRPVQLWDVEYDILVKSLNKSVYHDIDYDKVRIFIQNRSVFNLTPTNSVNNNFYNIVMKDCWYEIIDDNDTIWVEKTRLSRSKEYNYFYFIANQFPNNRDYKIKVYYTIDGIQYSKVAGTFRVI